MFRIIQERIRQKHRTLNYPHVQPQQSDRYCGRPCIDAGQCAAGCSACRDVCPTSAITMHNELLHEPVLDMGRCLFCGACAQACPQQRIHFTKDHKIAARTRKELLVAAEGVLLQERPSVRSLRLFYRSFKLRQVSAGGCNACEADCNVLTTLVYDLGRFGIDFVASPRHADGLAVTGPVTHNMHAALWDAYYALAEPRVVIAVGSCAISGGLFANSAECHQGIPSGMPVDIYIPGCPPNPWSILDGLLLTKAPDGV